MTDPPFISYAQNREDVLLNRALRNVETGTYVEVGANHPEILSITKAFSDKGWSGLLVEPDPEFAELLRRERPRDIVEQLAVSDADGTLTLHVFEGTGLSTTVDAISSGHEASGRTANDIEVISKTLSSVLTAAGFDDRPIHFMSIDTEGAEWAVLQGVDFTKHRPWILVVESTFPLTTEQVYLAWEPLVIEAGYRFCLFDGLSRYYLAEEKAVDLAASLSYPVCVFDEFDSIERTRMLERLRLQALQLESLSHDVFSLTNDLEHTRSEINRLLTTVSWRATAPLRILRRAVGRQPPR